MTDTQGVFAVPPEITLYDIRDWYWMVGADSTKLWSSKAAQYVPVADAGYQAWAAKGVSPSQAPDEAWLQDVLTEGGFPQGWSINLTTYAASARYAKETAGITVGTAMIATDRESQALITGMWAAAQINPQISVSFKSGSGFVTIGAAQVAKIAAAVAGYVQACFAAEGQVAAGIAAGVIKTTADVDKIIGAVTAAPVS